MIQAKDLRAGNLVFENTFNMGNGNYEGVPIVVNGNIIKTIELSPTLHAYSPIPLSPDILERCGFVTVNKDKFSDKFAYAFKENEHHFKFYPPNTLYWHGYPLNVEYLHQLQNLYFALTGEELTITL